MEQRARCRPLEAPRWVSEPISSCPLPKETCDSHRPSSTGISPMAQATPVSRRCALWPRPSSSSLRRPGPAHACPSHDGATFMRDAPTSWTPSPSWVSTASADGQRYPFRSVPLRARLDAWSTALRNVPLHDLRPCVSVPANAHHRGRRSRGALWRRAGACANALRQCRRAHCPHAARAWEPNDGPKPAPRIAARATRRGVRTARPPRSTAVRRRGVRRCR